LTGEKDFIRKALLVATKEGVKRKECLERKKERELDQNKRRGSFVGAR